MDRPFMLLGHRGARGLYPENTIGGFRAARDLGVTWFETDIAVSKDGQVVLHHDLALNPDVVSMDGHYFSGSLPLLKSLTSEDLEDYSVGRLRPGSDYAARFPGQLAIDGERIPTLADALAIDPALRWTLELKLMPDRPDWTVSVEEMLKQTLAVIDATGSADRVVIQSFDWRVPRLARQLRPEIAVAWLTRAETVADPTLWLDRPLTDSIPATIAEEGGGIWSPAHEDLTPALLQQAQAFGLVVIPWTVNEATDIERLIAWGVDGVITDFPDRAMLLARPGD